jgi:hypothetical protein
MNIDRGNNKSVWVSGETCESAGIYFSDTCGHSIRKEFQSGDLFIRCPTCLQAVRWMRFGRKPIGFFKFDKPSAYGLSRD